MKRVYRNRLNEMLLDSFAERDARRLLAFLAILIRLQEHAPTRTRAPGISWARIAERLPDSPAQIRDTAQCLAAAPSLVAISPAPEAGEEVALVAPLWEVRSEVGRMAEAYLAAVAEFDRYPPPADQLQRAFLQARICFDLGLFFETHEILEAQWHPLAKGLQRTFLQGLIQISVGFHHACRASYAGTVNQLGKGLEKVGRVLAKCPDPSTATFQQAVSSTRERLLAAGRERMVSLPLADVPPFPKALPAPFRAKRVESS